MIINFMCVQKILFVYLFDKLCLLQLKRVARAYFEEAKWFKDESIPSVEEYLRSGAFSTGYPMLATVSLVGMGDNVTEETFQWIFNDPKIVMACGTLFRLMDDIVTTKVTTLITVLLKLISYILILYIRYKI